MAATFRAVFRFALAAVVSVQFSLFLFREDVGKRGLFSTPASRAEVWRRRRGQVAVASFASVFPGDCRLSLPLDFPAIFGGRGCDNGLSRLLDGIAFGLRRGGDGGIDGAVIRVSQSRAAGGDGGLFGAAERDTRPVRRIGDGPALQGDTDVHLKFSGRRR